MSRISPPKRLVLAGLAVLLAGTGCATVRASRIRPDYEQVDRQKTKRLVVVVEPLPEGKQKVGELWSVIARRYINQKRQFIAKESRALSGDGGSGTGGISGGPAGTAFDAKGQCGEGIEGVLWLKPRIEAKGEGFEEQVNAVLLRCTDGQEVWSAEAGGSWRSRDEGLKAVTEAYVQELGPEVEPYVPPTLNLLRPLLDTLPDPVLTEDDKTEKIELGE